MSVLFHGPCPHGAWLADWSDSNDCASAPDTCILRAAGILKAAIGAGFSLAGWLRANRAPILPRILELSRHVTISSGL